MARWPHSCPRFLSEPARLEPLPVLGVPDWSANQSRAYYEDERYFRTRQAAATRAERARAWLRARLSCAQSRGRLLGFVVATTAF